MNLWGIAVGRVAVVGIVAMTMLTSAHAGEIPAFRCEAYGHLVQCRATNTGNSAIVWAAIWQPPHNKAESVYQAAGDTFGFNLHHSGRTQIEMHLPYADNFTPLRCWAAWSHGRVIFTKWSPEPE